MLKKMPFSLLLAVVGVWADCWQYKCHEGGIDWGNTCMVPQSGKYLLQVCESNLAPYCDVTPTTTKNFTCTQMPRPENQVAYPGEPCVRSSDCLSGFCLNDICLGSALGEKCSSHKDCNVGLYCDPKGLCRFQKARGMPCDSEYECHNELSCNRTIYEGGACIPYFSIENDQPVGMCVSKFTEGYSNLCKSGTCLQNTYAENGPGICKAPLTTYEGFPKKCESNSDCLGKNSNAILQGVCSCAMSPEGTSYCEAFSGDPPTIETAELLKQHFNSNGITNCHTERRNDGYCFTQTLPAHDFYNYTQQKLLASNTPRYQDNDDCTKAVYNSDYWRLTEGDFSCKAYKCDNSTSWREGVCISYMESINTFGIQECSNNQYCDYELAIANQWLNVTCGGTMPQKEAYPGEPCDQSTHCLHSSCVSGTCEGTPQGGSCETTQECNPGLYCDLDPNNSTLSFVCLPLKGYGEPCISEFQCKTTAGCGYANGSNGKICIEYFTLGDSHPVECAKSGENDLCKSGTCYNVPGKSLGYCTSPPSYDVFPKECRSSGECLAQNVLGEEFVGECSCGYNPQAKSYCSPFLADEAGMAYFQEIQSYLTNPSMVVCQTTRRHSTTCAKMVAEQMKRNPLVPYIKILNYTNFAKYIDNDQCVKDVFTANFWNNIPPPPPPVNFSMSGLGSGATFAVQMQFAFSESVIGSGVIAGVPYYCAEDSLQKSRDCAQKPSSINLSMIQNVISDYESRNLIDNTKNLTGTKMWVFGGIADFNTYIKTVKQVETLAKMYLNPSNVGSMFNVKAGHGFITSNWGNQCYYTDYPFINNCNIDSAGDILGFLYGNLNPKGPERSENVYTFSQKAYVADENWVQSSMADTGYMYLPKSCQNQKCSVHLVFHGCNQDYDSTSGSVIHHTGYNEWAETNKMIILYPQVKITDGSNPEACWDWWGYTDENYATKQGIQMKAIYNMVQNLPKPNNSVKLVEF